MKRKRRLTEAERLAILADVDAYDPPEARTRARVLGVSWSTIRGWRRRLAEGGTLADRRQGRPPSEVVRRLDDLEERVGSLEADVRGSR